MVRREWYSAVVNGDFYTAKYEVMGIFFKDGVAINDKAWSKPIA